MFLIRLGSGYMKKLLDILDYTYYRLYKFFSSHRFFTGMEEIDSISTIMLTIFFPFACIGGSICHEINIVLFERHTISRFLGMVAMIVIFYLPMMRRYMFNKSITKGKYRIFRERWEKEDPKQRKKRGWLIAALVINNLVIFPIILAVSEHYLIQ